MRRAPAARAGAACGRPGAARPPRALRGLRRRRRAAGRAAAGAGPGAGGEDAGGAGEEAAAAEVERLLAAWREAGARLAAEGGAAGLRGALEAAGFGVDAATGELARQAKEPAPLPFGLESLAQNMVICFAGSFSASSLALQWFVELMIGAHTAGLALPAVEARLRVYNSDMQALNPMEEQQVLTWTQIVFFTLQELGVLGAARPPMGQEGAYTKGVRKFVQSVLEMAQQGYNLERFKLEQKLNTAAGADAKNSPAAMGPAAQMMQQNSRIVLYTLDLLHRDGAIKWIAELLSPNEKDVEVEPEEEKEPEAGAAAAAGDAAAGEGGPEEAAAEEVEEPQTALSPKFRDTCGKPILSEERFRAVGLALSFKGAVVGFQVAADCFLDLAVDAYRVGLGPPELLQQLSTADFRKESGLEPVGRFGDSVAQLGTPSMLGDWLALVWLALERSGLPCGQPAEGADAAAGTVAERLAGGLALEDRELPSQGAMLSQYVESTVALMDKADEDFDWAETSVVAEDLNVPVFPMPDVAGEESPTVMLLRKQTELIVMAFQQGRFFVEENQEVIEDA